ncbi:MAG: outer membrane beta-barrel protein, partial [Proteiniphilum sp.]|nr:outer membrane beta-barrel protein [Proteiniphilum sp.]
YSTTQNSLEAKKNQEDINYRASLNSQFNFPKDWVFESSLQYSGQSGLSTGYNRNETLWNINVNKRFMKNKQATVSFRWTDVLQQRLSIRRNVTSNYIEDSESNVLTGYFMVSFSYRFNNFAGAGSGGGRGGEGRMRRGDFGGGRMRTY